MSKNTQGIIRIAAGLLAIVGSVVAQHQADVRSHDFDWGWRAGALFAFGMLMVFRSRNDR